MIQAKARFFTTTRSRHRREGMKRDDIMRMGSKDVSAQEIAKGEHYIQKLLEVLQEVSE